MARAVGNAQVAGNGITGIVSGTPMAGGVSATLNVPGLAQPANNVLMVFGCISAWREAVGGVPLRITDANDNLVDSGPVFKLFRKPNQIMNWGQYVRVLETYNRLYNCIAIAKVDIDGPAPELIPLNPGALRPVMGVHLPTGTPMPMAWIYVDPTTGSYREFKPDQIVVHQGFNPEAPLSPLSPVTVLRRTMQGDITARDQNLALFQNDATPRGILSTDHLIDKNQAEEIMQKFNDAQMGYLNKYKTACLWGGVKYTAVGLNPQEMDFIESLKYMRTDYYIVFRMTPCMMFDLVGETGLSQGSSTESQKVAWWEDTGLPELSLIAEIHQTEIVDKHFSGKTSAGVGRLNRNDCYAKERHLRRTMRAFPDSGMPRSVTLWFDDNSIPCLVRHRLGKVDQATKILAVGYRPDDINEYLDMGLPPHPDNLGRVGFSLSTIGDSAPEKPAVPKENNQQNQQPDNVEATDENPAQRAIRSLDMLEESLCRIERAEKEKFNGVKQAFDKFCAPREKAAARKFSRFYMEQRDRVLARIEQSQSKRTDSAENIQRAGTLDPKNIGFIFPIEEENKQLLARMTPLWTEHMKDGWNFFNNEMSIEPQANPFEVDDPMIQKAIERRQIQGSKVNETTQEDLKKIIADSFETGDTTSQMGDRIASWYNDNCIGENSARPMAAARTQTSGIVNEGRMMAAEEVGGLKKAWLHGNPAEARDSHLEAQRRYLDNPIPLDQKFKVGPYECDQPGSTELPVGEVVNCTCMVIFTKE